ncbi:MAG: D-2-hydroxyacid dehydrogenase [Treponema sp.]|jgi:phosphoglycerate dehydrogenase-like enzyme|nr:D-2-hydroxyacid dehydrogenase [Treponema sp.]
METQKSVILLSMQPFRLLPEFGEQLEAAGKGREVLISRDAAGIEPYLDRIEIGLGDVPYGLLPRMPKLKWLQLWSAGADFLQKFPEAKQLPFQLTTATGIHGRQLAEHLFAMLLGWNRRLPDALAAQKQHVWFFADDQKLSVCAGKTMLILGYGVIGGTIAGAALGLGIKVTGLRRNPARGGGTEGVRIENAARLLELLPGADYVVNLLPSTPDTRHCFGAAEFGRMKSSALYINLGRGATTDEAAMIEALKSKSIAGAMLDVVEKEPLDKDSPLWDLDNVIITGHYAGCHPDYSRMAMGIALENLDRYNRGEPLRNLVDKNKGY